MDGKEGVGEVRVAGGEEVGRWAKGAEAGKKRWDVGRCWIEGCEGSEGEEDCCWVEESEEGKEWCRWWKSVKRSR